MKKITVEIDGMACGMCEAHINGAVRNGFKVKKVSSSFKKGETVILAENVDTEKLKAVIENTGYTVKDIKTEEYEKKKILFFGR